MKCVFNALVISDDDFNHRDFGGNSTTKKPPVIQRLQNMKSGIEEAV
jgi:hypothetical protein